MLGMDQLREVVLILLGIGAVLGVVGLAAGLYEVTTARLAFRAVPFRWRIPATPADIQRHGLAIVLNNVTALLVDLLVLGAILLEGHRFDRALAVSYAVVSLAGFASIFLLAFASLQIGRGVRYLARQTPSSITTAPHPPSS